MFIAVLDIVVKTCKPPNYPSNYEWMNKMWYTPLPYYLAMKRNEVMIYYHTDEPWKHVKEVKEANHKRQLINPFICRGRSVETECRDPWLPTAGRIGRRDGHGVSFWDWECSKIRFWWWSMNYNSCFSESVGSHVLLLRLWFWMRQILWPQLLRQLYDVPWRRSLKPRDSVSSVTMSVGMYIALKIDAGQPCFDNLN